MRVQLRVRKPQEVGSQINLNQLFLNTRNRIAVLPQTFDIPANRVLNIEERFRTCLALANATRQRGTLNNEDAILILLNKHSILHLECSSSSSNSTTMETAALLIGVRPRKRIFT